MELEITSLNSGSNGNCYYIGNSNDAILIDVGISCREVERRMRALSLPIEKLKAIFISHEHSDHIRGVPVLSKKYNLPVYVTPATRKKGRIYFKHEAFYSFAEKLPVNIGHLTVTAFKKFHDAADPYSFTIEYRGIKVGVFTDIGKCCDNLIMHFKHCHAAFLESNYDEEMLENGRYPYYLKSRIRGGLGHLSNKEALDLFIQHRSPSLKYLILSHLSQENNHPEIVEKLFNSHAESTEIIVASRHEPTKLIKLQAEL